MKRVVFSTEKNGRVIESLEKAIAFVEENHILEGRLAPTTDAQHPDSLTILEIEQEGIQGKTRTIFPSVASGNVTRTHYFKVVAE